MIRETRESELRRIARLPKLIFVVTCLLLATGFVASLVSWQTNDFQWTRWFFSGPGALFLVGCSALQFWLSLQCWRRFSPGDMLRPAWLLIAISASAQLIGGTVSHILAAQSYLNPVRLLPGPLSESLIRDAAEYGPLSNPLSMVFLSAGLFYVLKACRHNGILARLRPIDVLLLMVVIAYTINFFETVVFSPSHPSSVGISARILSWTSDPLLCILLFQAVVIRRSFASLGLGLIARCWLCFTAAIFATSVGDIGLWAWSKGYLPRVLEIASWYVWFLASAAFALGPAYQLEAMLHATQEDDYDEIPAGSEPVPHAV